VIGRVCICGRVNCERHRRKAWARPHRHPDVGAIRREHACERAWCNAHNRERLRLRSDSASKNVRASAEPVLPHGMADDGDRLCLAREPAAECGRNTKDCPVVRGHDLNGDELAYTIDVQIRFHRE